MKCEFGVGGYGGLGNYIQVNICICKPSVNIHKYLNLNSMLNECMNVYKHLRKLHGAHPSGILFCRFLDMMLAPYGMLLKPLSLHKGIEVRLTNDILSYIYTKWMYIPLPHKMKPNIPLALC